MSEIKVVFDGSLDPGMLGSRVSISTSSHILKVCQKLYGMLRRILAGVFLNLVNSELHQM